MAIESKQRVRFIKWKLNLWLFENKFILNKAINKIVLFSKTCEFRFYPYLLYSWTCLTIRYKILCSNIIILFSEKVLSLINKTCIVYNHS